MNEKLIKKFRRECMGWLSPQGELHVCLLHQHLDVLEKLGLFPEEFRVLDQWKDEDAESLESFLSQFGPDDHVEWHHYESNHDYERIPKQQRRIANLAYKAGWVRLGYSSQRSNPFVEAEGTKEALHKHADAAGFIADCLNVQLIQTRVNLRNLTD